MPLSQLVDESRTVGRPKGKPTKTVRAYLETVEALERCADAFGFSTTAEYLETLIREGLDRDIPIAEKVLNSRVKAIRERESKQ